MDATDSRLTRINKVLASAGVCSRRHADDLIAAGRVTVNGAVVTEAGLRIDPARDALAVDGAPVNLTPELPITLALHKKPGVVTTASDPEGRPTVFDGLPEPWRGKRLFPVGRLDKDTEGLLLLTNDGVLAHRLLSPKWKVDKRYQATIDGVVTAADVAAFAQGVVLDDGYKTQPGVLEVVASGPVSEVLVTIAEGKFHQVKRMFEAVGKTVTYLKRLTMGPLALDETLALGEYRELTDKEKQQLFAAVRLPGETNR